MKNLWCFLLVMFSAAAAAGQRSYFIYFESENSAPFYLKIGDELHRSSSAGHLILSNLGDSTQNFSIGFSSAAKEHRFSLPMAGRDHGLLIRNFEFGVGLFDLQTLAVIRPQVNNNTGGWSYQYRTNDFVSLLAKASNDTSLFYVPVRIEPPVVVKQEEPVPVKAESGAEQPVDSTVATVLDTMQLADTGAVVAQTGTVPETLADSSAKVVADADSAVVEVAIMPPADTAAVDMAITAPLEVYQRSNVRRHAESSTSEGFGLVFYDEYGGQVDTIRLVIPNPKILFAERDTTRFENGLLELPERELAGEVEVQEKQVEEKPAASEPECPSTASGRDFFKLRKYMASQESDEDMRAEARKYFKKKCFTTEQVKNLSTLFLTSEGKFLFFVEAYRHVSDRESFGALQSEIKDNRYSKRFQELIGQ